MTEPPMMTWEDLKVGDQLRPYEFHVDPRLVETYRSALEDRVVTSVDDHDVAPPTLMTFPILQSIDYTWSQRPGMVHAKQRFNFLAPMRVGSTLTVTGNLTSMYLRRGRRYMIIDTEVTDDSGRTVGGGSTLLLYPTPSVKDDQ